VAVIAVVLIGGGIGMQAWRSSRDPVAPGRAVAASPVPVEQARPLAFGDPVAPVTLRLYEDFHCPHCADFEEAYAPVINAAVDRGEVRLQLYPMAFVDEGSVRAAGAMACAAEAGFGRAFYAGLFDNPDLDWRTEQLLALGASVAPLTEGAGSPGAGASAAPAGFAACVLQDRHRAWVDSINAAGDSAGVTQTPTLFLNDQPVDITRLDPAGLARSIAEAAAL
jgi:protein-disulfide isomerase